MPTSKTQNLSPFKFFYKRMKVIIIEDLYQKIGIVNGTIGFVQNISIKRRYWTHYNELMHPHMNILVDFTKFIEKNDILQNITLKG
jgi:hypothetical protein